MSEWFCGFETGNLNDDSYPSPSGFSINVNSPRFGNFCGTLTAVANLTSSFVPGYATSSLPYAALFGVNTPFAFSCALRVDRRPSSGYEEILTIQGLQICLSSTGVLQVYTGFTTLVVSGTTVLTPGQWYVFELYSTSTTQRFRVYPDGSAPGADEFSVSSSIGSTTFNLGKSFNINSQSITTSWDDIWIKDGVGGYLGTAHVYLVSGTNDPPLYDGFSKTGAGPNAADCWNETPSNPATACTSNAAGAVKQSMAHHPLWPIGSTATINSVKTTVVGSNSQSDPLDEMHLVGPTGSIVEYDTPIALQFSSYWSVMWSVVPSLTDLNSSQIGVYRLAGSANITTIYECYLQACFSNLVLPATPAVTSTIPLGDMTLRGTTGTNVIPALGSIFVESPGGSGGSPGGGGAGAIQFVIM